MVSSSDLIMVYFAREWVKLTEEDLIDKVSRFHPHPVYIYPESKLVTAGNFVARNEFKKIY